MFKIAEEQGITHIQLFALHTIAKHGELAMNKTADALHCDPSNVTGLMDRLVAQGLVVRQECASDRRAKLLRLTSKGSAIVAEMRDAFPARLGCEHLTADEQATLHTLLQKLCAASAR